jgi:hypothetical protein
VAISDRKNLPSERRGVGRRPAFTLSIDVSPKKVAWALVLLALCLTAASMAGHFLRPVLGEVAKLLSVGSDVGIPAWYSSLALFFASVLVMTIAAARKARGDRRYLYRWTFLSVIFLYLSADEMLALHEKASSTLVQPVLKATPYSSSALLNYPWVVLYGPLVLILALAYLRFWFDLPATTRLLFFVAGGLFVGGGIVVEVFNGWYAAVYGTGDLVAATMTHFEELCEMLGIIVFIYALMAYVGSHLRVGEIQMRLCDDRHLE